MENTDLLNDLAPVIGNLEEISMPSSDMQSWFTTLQKSDKLTQHTVS
jgi:hypothetical protein